jgi:hypothetical protein
MTTTYEPIHLPGYAWTDQAVLDACAGLDANRLLKLVHHRYGITQERLGHYIGLINAIEINKRINGRKTGKVETLRRWQAIANALNMPDQPRALIGLAPQTPPAEVASKPETAAVPTAGVRLTSPVLADLIGDDMRRRELLRLLAVAGGGAVLPSAQPPWDRLTAALNGDTPRPSVDELAARSAGLFDLEEQMPSAALYPAAVEHLNTLTARIQTAGPSTRLVSLAGETSALAGWLAFDSADPATARAYYQAALDAAKQAGDPALTSCVLGYLSYLPPEHSGSTVALLDQAIGHAEHSATPASRAWLAARRAEEHARAGNRQAALASLDLARNLHQQSTQDDRAWTRFFDHARLNGMAAATYARTGRLTDAEQCTAEATAALPSLAAAKKRTLILLDVATAMLSRGQLDQACHYACAAIASATESSFGYGAERLRQFRAQLAPHNADAVRRLDGQLGALPLLTRPPA